MKTAKDLIGAPPITIPSTMTLEDVSRILVEKRISGVPVVDENGKLVGIVSEYQLMALVYDSQLKTKPVSDFMTKDVFTVSEDTAVAEIANLFIVQRIRRVPVLDGNGELIGVVSRPDLLKYMVETGFREADENALAV